MINQSQLEEVIRVAEQSTLGDALIATLRDTFPGVHFTYCMDDDVPVHAKPFVERKAFNVYLVNSSDHCSILTNDPEVASGVVLAEVIED